MNAATEPDQALVKMAEDCTARISRLEYMGQFYWVKKEEKLSLLRRLQKGVSGRAFEHERAALRELSQAGAPVPPIVAEGKDFFVLPDQGPSLKAIHRGTIGNDPSLKDRAFRDGAMALARLHAQHLSHGRPNLKDVCWDDGRVSFIDLENYSDTRNTPRGQARDVVLFFFNGLAVAGEPVRELYVAREAYRENDPGGVWETARGLVRSVRWMNWLTKPIQKLPGATVKEFKAIPLTLKFFDV